MRPFFAAIKDACPGIDEKLIREHFSRLDDRYFNNFNDKQICRHLDALSRLSSNHPMEILLEGGRDKSVDCTVFAFDYPFEFSLITGVLAAMGFSILSGAVFTYERVKTQSLPDQFPRQRLKRRKIAVDPIKRRRIIDHFSGVVDTSLSFENWQAELKLKMDEIITLLEGGDDQSIVEAKRRVNEMVAKHLSDLNIDTEVVLYPVQIAVDNDCGPFTRLKVVSEDTPVFLYALTNALSLHGISIEQVGIHTIKNRIEDEIDLLDSHGNKIENLDVINQIKLSVLLTKQFTYFLGKAPNPSSALDRFDHLVEDILKLPGQKKRWTELFSNSLTLQDLARILGTSDFLWEDFIRLQYETILPMLESGGKRRRFSDQVETLPQKIDQFLECATSREEKQRRFNEFKDQEIFLLDLDQILNPEIDFRSFAERLTCLAEVVVSKAAEIIYQYLVIRFGIPRTVAGLEAKYAIFGLGKLGGAALGYASDIELLFVYNDNGRTDGKKPVKNGEFFIHLVRETAKFIQAKREGIFHVDLRLRPYGDSGPMACSLESFCQYYGRGGPAHSYELLALVRLRAIGGDEALGSQVERLRDEMVYAARNINLNKIKDLRERQFKKKITKGRLNAKFSPGGLVDLEYDVQILQVMHGKDIPSLRTPRIHKALISLAEAGVLPPEESRRLSAAYDFLRRLINGMRMLRGSALDLFLPPLGSDEFVHLARRIGYEKKGNIDPPRKLHLEFEIHTAVVRTFVEHHFGRDSLPGPATGNVADLILSDNIPDDLYRRILLDAGFKDPKKAYINLRHLAGHKDCRDTFARLAVLAYDILRRKPDSDMALNNWERFIKSLPDPKVHFEVLLSQPMRLEILLSIFSGSQFLADTLVKNPEFFDWVTTPENVHKIRIGKSLEDELKTMAKKYQSQEEWLNGIRRFRRREILRIGIRDICLKVSTREIMLELSLLAESITQIALERAWLALKQEGRLSGDMDNPAKFFCIMALGKLGGEELNYSSDIDLLGIYDDFAIQKDGGNSSISFHSAFFARVMEKLRSDLSLHTEEGYAYRVDLRLRPYGGAGGLVPSVSSLTNYYQKVASLWEIQAALKIRPIAGNLQVGCNFITKMRSILLEPRKPKDIVRSIENMRQAALKIDNSTLKSRIDIKSGKGGLRDVEFLVQGLQLIYGPENSGLLSGNTLSAIELLKEADTLPRPVADQLKEDYTFLRRVEHYLQILEDRQIHALPQDPDEVRALARRMLGVEGKAKQFMKDIRACLERIRDSYNKYLLHNINIC